MGTPTLDSRKEECRLHSSKPPQIFASILDAVLKNVMPNHEVKYSNTNRSKLLEHYYID